MNQGLGVQADDTERFCNTEVCPPLTLVGFCTAVLQHSGHFVLFRSHSSSDGRSPHRRSITLKSTTLPAVCLLLLRLYLSVSATRNHNACTMAAMNVASSTETDIEQRLTPVRR